MVLLKIGHSEHNCFSLCVSKDFNGTVFCARLDFSEMWPYLFLNFAIQCSSSMFYFRMEQHFFLTNRLIGRLIDIDLRRMVSIQEIYTQYPEEINIQCVQVVDVSPWRSCKR